MAIWGNWGSSGSLLSPPSRALGGHVNPHYTSEALGPVDAKLTCPPEDLHPLCILSQTLRQHRPPNQSHAADTSTLALWDLVWLRGYGIKRCHGLLWESRPVGLPVTYLLGPSKCSTCILSSIPRTLPAMLLIERLMPSTSPRRAIPLFFKEAPSGQYQQVGFLGRAPAVEEPEQCTPEAPFKDTGHLHAR